MTDVTDPLPCPICESPLGIFADEGAQHPIYEGDCPLEGLRIHPDQRAAWNTRASTADLQARVEKLEATEAAWADALAIIAYESPDDPSLVAHNALKGDRSDHQPHR